MSEQIFNLIDKYSKIRVEKEKNKCTLYDLGIDSLHFLQLLTELEKTLGIEIDDDEWIYKEEITIPDIYDLVKGSGKNGAV